MNRARGLARTLASRASCRSGDVVPGVARGDGRIETPVTNKTRIDELKATGRLPSPTGVALAVLHLTQEPNTTVEQLANLLKGDPALSGRILKFANSAFTGARRPAVAVSEAAVRIGFRKVSQVALGFSLLSSYRNGPCSAFDYEGFWSEAIATAASARALSAHIKSTSAEEAFSFGLLSQIGRLAFATVHPEHYEKVLKNVTLPYDESLCRLEREAFALDHNELTAAMLEDWGLPQVFVEAARCQDSPSKSGLAPESRD
jgi:two-component system, cell cycle response regulator